MPQAFRSARDHVDAIVNLARHVFERPRMIGDRLAGQDLAIIELGEGIEASLEIARVRGFELPLDRLRAAFQLEPAELYCVYLALALSVSTEVRALAGSPDGTLTIEALEQLVYRAPSVRDRFSEHLGIDGRLFTCGLLEFTDSRRGRLARPIAVAEHVVELAHGNEQVAAEIRGFVTLRDAISHDLLFPDELVVRVSKMLESHAETSVGPVPILLGPEGSGRRSLVETAAHALGAKLLLVHCEALPDEGIASALVAVKREAIYTRATIVLVGIEHLLGDPNVGGHDRARHVAAAFAGYPGPLAMTGANDTRTSGFVMERGIRTIELPSLSEFDRATLWGRALPPDVAVDAAARYRLTGGQILAASRTITEICSDRSPTSEDLQGGVRAIVDDGLTTLGVRIEWRQGWDDLVLPNESLDELREMISRVRHRRLVLDDWGFGAKMAKGFGVAALFSGPPGTGKTMVAGIVARELGLDLYQIDLSRMVSKYVGETEKNLAKVFEAAEAGHTILLFDEADSLFSKRTEVKSSVDRYANLEVNYLLQRMEAFEGITILTTNFDSAIDEAFRRRLAFRIHFPLPEEEEREDLWRAMLPAAALGERAIDFGDLAARFAMSGGYIRNAALRAAYLAAGEGTRIGMQHLMRAATAEYASMGKVMTTGGTHAHR